MRPPSLAATRRSWTARAHGPARAAGDALLTTPSGSSVLKRHALVETDAGCSRSSSAQRRFKNVTAAVRSPAHRVPAYPFPSASLPIEAIETKSGAGSA